MKKLVTLAGLCAFLSFPLESAFRASCMQAVQAFRSASGRVKNPFRFFSEKPVEPGRAEQVKSSVVDTIQGLKAELNVMKKEMTVIAIESGSLKETGDSLRNISVQMAASIDAQQKKLDLGLRRLQATATRTEKQVKKLEPIVEKLNQESKKIKWPEILLGAIAGTFVAEVIVARIKQNLNREADLERIEQERTMHDGIQKLVTVLLTNQEQMKSLQADVQQALATTDKDQKKFSMPQNQGCISVPVVSEQDRKRLSDLFEEHLKKSKHK